jgi:hypothetical protein
MNDKTDYCMSCGKETRSLVALIGGWYCQVCAKIAKEKGLDK